MTTRDESGVTWHEVLRFARGEETRIYHLCVVTGGVELWRTIESPGPDRARIKECDFTDADETARFLEEVRRTLTAGGWRAR